MNWMRWTLGWLACCTLSATATPTSPAGTGRVEQQEWLCEAVYMPARSTWVRSVRIHYDDRRVRQVKVDGLPVYAFQVLGTTILTALDNERIQMDLAQQTWTSDFRGQAQGQGRCERQP